MAVSLFLYVLVVLALLIAELRDDRRAQFFFKPLAALGFVILALQFGALNSIYGKYILAGLLACAAGDVFLLARKSHRLFIAGMVAFALGHIIYSFGFMSHGLELEKVNGRKAFYIATIACMICLASAAIIIPKSERVMRLPIIIYSVIITTMCVLAALTYNIILIIAALAFAASDYFVGMDRFIDPKKIWALAITPLYFAAQALFALSVSI